jgi:hypothetical protein
MSACEVTFETWIRYSGQREMAGILASVAGHVAVLVHADQVRVDVHAAEADGAYAHVAVLARSDRPDLHQWGELHVALDRAWTGRVAVSKITIWVPHALREMVTAGDAEQLIRETGCMPHTWSDYEGEVKISQQPSRA